MRIIASGGYPWDGIPEITNAWIADRRYLDSGGSVGLVNPSKGTIPLVQATAGSKPAYSVGYGSGNFGRLTYDAVDDWMSADAIAALVTGNPGNPPHDFTIIQSFNLLTVTGKPSPWAFGDTSNAHSIFTIIPQSPGLGGVTEFWQVNWFDDATHATTESDIAQTVVGKVVLTCIYSRAANRTTVRLNGVPLATVINSPSGTGQTTLTKFTIGAFRGASVLQPTHMDWRSTAIAPSILLPPAYRSVENFDLSQAA